MSLNNVRLPRLSGRVHLPQVETGLEPGSERSSEEKWQNHSNILSRKSHGTGAMVTSRMERNRCTGHMTLIANSDTHTGSRTGQTIAFHRQIRIFADMKSTTLRTHVSLGNPNCI